MARWSQKTEDVEVDAYTLPAINSDWYNTGAWVTHVSLNPHELGKKIPKSTAYNLKINLYSPSVKHALSPGELEKVLIEAEKTMDNYAFEVEHSEILGKNYRKMFSLCLGAYVIGLAAVNTWWFIWFRQPFLAAAGIDNWLKNRQAKKLLNYNSREITVGKDLKKVEAINEVFEFYKTLNGRYLEICQKLRDYCKSKKKSNKAFAHIEQAYRDVIDLNLEDSYFVKYIAHAFPKKFVRFFLGDMIGISNVRIPKIAIPTRDLGFDLSSYIKGNKEKENKEEKNKEEKAEKSEGEDK